MTDPKLQWLLACARTLNRGQESRVALRPVLRELGVGLEKHVDDNAKPGAGLMRQGCDGKYHIVLRRRHPEPRPLTPRERFTIAHELAHILLCERYSWNPKGRRDYYVCEDWCDAFAAELLVPELKVDELELRSARDGFLAVNMLSAKLHVSKEVVARRVSSKAPGFIFIQAQEALDAKSKRVMRVLWAVSSLNDVSLNRFAHLNSNHPLGAPLLKRRTIGGPQGFHIPGVGEAFGQATKGRWIVAVYGKCECLPHPG